MAYSINNRGFTLIEVLIATILIGLSIAALLVANGSFTMANAVGADLSTAEFLVEQIRELTTVLAVVDPETKTDTFGPEEAGIATYDDLDDLDGAVFSPPINAHRAAMNEFATYSQQIIVENLNPSDFNQVVADHASPFVRITVRVLHSGAESSSASWVRAKY